MPALLQDAAGQLFAEQPDGARLDYSFDWQLASDTVVTSTWTALPALVITDQEIEGNRTTAVLSGGTAGRWHMVTNTITTSGGRIDRQSFALLITPSLAGQASGLFASAFDAVAGVRRDRLVNLARSHLAGAAISDDLIWRKLLAAEGEAERTLRTWLAPREVVPIGAAYDAEAAALAAQGKLVEREPGYDYDPAMFAGERWGLIELRQRPVLAVTWIAFAYPQPDQPFWQVPTDWIRREGRTNKVQLVPVSTGVTAPLNAFLMSAMGGGRRIPHMMLIRYRAGHDEPTRAFPDLPDVVRRMACLSLVDDLLPEQSGSVSADGLSQSVSFEAEKHREAIKAKLESMRDRAQGIRMVVV